MPKNIKFKKKTKSFIETGSYLGDGIQLAIDSGFEKIYSIELSDKYYNISRDRFSSNKNILIIKGDSYFELKNIIDNTDESFTYWLDGHYSGGDTGFGKLEFPIMEELECILKRDINNEVIYIDDMRIINNYNNEINKEKIVEKVSKYKSRYKISYEDSSYAKNDIMIIEY